MSKVLGENNNGIDQYTKTISDTETKDSWVSVGLIR